VSHDYIWSGDRLLAEVTDDYILKFFYDASGNVLGFEYLTPTIDASGNTDYIGTTYYYEKNLFGDVVAIYDENGTKVGAYGFNSFGQNNVVTNLTDDNIASLNPIRYRSYYYDTDIYLYYLQSRYYDPVTCRFINADIYINGNGGILGHNMFSYCSNNPVLFTDTSGYSIWNDLKNGFDEFVIFIDELIALIPDFKNDDGTYSLYDNNRGHRPDKYHEQLFVVDPTNFCGIDGTSNGNTTEIGTKLSIGGSFTIYTGGYEFDNWDLSLFDFGELTAELALSAEGLALGLGASIWSPTVSFEVAGYEIELGLIFGVEYNVLKGPNSLGVKNGYFSFSISKQ